MDDWDITDIDGLPPEFFQQVVPLLDSLNLLVENASGHPDHHSRVCQRLSLYLNINGKHGYPITNRLTEAAIIVEENMAVVLTMEHQERSNVQICFSALSALRENRSKRKVLRNLRDFYLKQADFTRFMISVGHMRKFQAYQVELLNTTRNFFAIWEQIVINCKQLHYDIFLSETERNDVS